MNIENVDILELVPEQIIQLLDKLNYALKVVKERKRTTSKISYFEKSKLICPYCNSLNIIKYGHTKEKIQNYMCKDCKHKFNDLTNSVFSGTKLNYEQLEIFIQCFRDRVPLRKTAERMNVNKNTVHLLRLKIIDVFKSMRNNIKLKGEIEVDELYRPINLKGTKPKDMPRASKRRTSNGTATRGISKHKICIETAIDEYDNAFFEIVGTGPITSNMIKISLGSKIDEVKKVTTDCKSSYEEIAKENKWNLKQIKSKTYTDNEGNSLANINSIQSGLTTFLAPFRGVSTKHLQGYLDWYIFDKYLNYHFEEKSRNNNLLKNIINKTTQIFTSNVYSNQSGIDFADIYSDYGYIPPTTN